MYGWRTPCECGRWHNDNGDEAYVDEGEGVGEEEMVRLVCLYKYKTI